MQRAAVSARGRGGGRRPRGGGRRQVGEARALRASTNLAFPRPRAAKEPCRRSRAPARPPRRRRRSSTRSRAPAAAALVVAALDQLEDRPALRLAHLQLRDAVGEATGKLEVPRFAAAPPPTPRRWPRVEEPTMHNPDAAARRRDLGPPANAEPWRTDWLLAKRSKRARFARAGCGAAADARAVRARVVEPGAYRRSSGRTFRRSRRRARAAEPHHYMRCAHAGGNARAGRDRLAARGARPELQRPPRRRRRRGARRRGGLCDPSPRSGSLWPGRGRPLLAPAAAWRRLPRLRAPRLEREDDDLEPPVALAATGWRLEWDSLHQKFVGGEPKKGRE